jgi:hypothetical protein
MEAAWPAKPMTMIWFYGPIAKRAHCAMPRQSGRQTQLNGDAMQALVARPQFRSCRQPHGSEQVDIDVSGGAPEQGVVIDEMQHLRIRGNDGSRQVRQGVQHGLSPGSGCLKRVLR